MILKGGYAGKILRIDLSKERHTVEDLDPEFAAKFIGGRGFGSIILYRELQPGIDPLGPENIVVLTPGALTGTAAPAQAELPLLSSLP